MSRTEIEIETKKETGIEIMREIGKENGKGIETDGWTIDKMIEDAVMRVAVMIDTAAEMVIVLDIN